MFVHNLCGNFRSIRLIRTIKIGLAQFGDAIFVILYALAGRTRCRADLQTIAGHLITTAS